MQALLRTVAVGTVLALALPVVRLAGQGTDPVIGTWELNLAKSKFSPGPPPKSETRTYVAAGQDIKATSKGVGPDGKPTLVQWTVNYDGKDRAETGSPDADAVALKHIDAYTTEFTEKRAGKVVTSGTRVVSRDGKVLTLTTKGVNAKGQTINDVQVFDKR